MTRIRLPSATRCSGIGPRCIRLVIVLLVSRSLSISHKVRGLLAHVPGRILCVVVVAITVRLLSFLDPAASPRSSIAPEWLVQDLLGLVFTCVFVMSGARSPGRPPFILNTGDIGLLDVAVLARVSLTAGIISRLPGIALGGIYLTAVLVGIAPESWPNLYSRLVLWLVLVALGFWMTSARLICGCAAWAVPRSRLPLTLAWLAVPGPVLVRVLTRIDSDGVRSIDVFGDLIGLLMAHAGAALVTALGLALVNYMVVVAMAPRLTPLWALPAYQVGAILDLAGGGDASAALALVRPPRARSRHVPGLVHGHPAFTVRQMWEAARRRTGRVVLGEVLVAYILSCLVGRFLPRWWQVAILVLGGLVIAPCVRDGALAESRYPLYSAVSATRSAALSAAFWSCLLPAVRAWSICLAYVFAGAHGRVDHKALVTAFGCVVTWPFFASSCSAGAGLLSMRGVAGRLIGFASAFSALGGPLILAVGEVSAQIAPASAVLAVQIGCTAIASWAILYLSLARWSSANYTAIVFHSPNDLDQSNRME